MYEPSLSHSSFLTINPPKKRFKWQRFHTFFTVIFVLHIFLFLVLGKYYGITRIKIKSHYKVTIIRKVNRGKVKESKKGLLGKAKSAKKLRKIKDIPKKSAKKNVKQKSYKVSLKRTQTHSTQPPKLVIPKANYRKFSPGNQRKSTKSNNRRRRPEVLQRNDLAGSGRTKGKNDSTAFRGDKKGKAFTYLHVRICYPSSLSFPMGATFEEQKEIYKNSSDASPLLIVGGTIHKDWDFRGLGEASIDYHITIPGSLNVADNKVHPSMVKFLRIESLEKPENKQRILQFSKICLSESLWLQAKNGNRPVEQSLKVTVKFLDSGIYDR